MSIQFQVQSQTLADNYFSIGEYLGQAVHAVKCQGGHRCSFSTDGALDDLTVRLLEKFPDVTYLRAWDDGTDIFEFSQGTLKRNGRIFAQGFR